jgi:uncharacterized protein YbjT (DUF2867 family)
MRILIAGASGFVGRQLAPALVDAGHDVAAMTRRPDAYTGAGTAVSADLDHPETLAAALAGSEVAYYLVHSLDRGNFARRDANAARAFGAAAAGAGITQIIYLSGLGDPDDALSEHLRSRHEVEQLLGNGGVAVTALRAGVIVGDLGTSWEMIHQLVERVPVLPVPTWARTRTQPIAIDDVVRYLIGVLALESARSGTFEIGGSEVLRYTEILSRVSALEGRPSLMVRVPAPSRRLAALAASRILPVITGVDGRTIRALVESLPNETVVRDDRIRDLVPFEPMDFDRAALAALGQRARRRRLAVA